MNYEQLKEEIQEIASIAATVPEEFRNKCFEMLLAKLLEGQATHTPLPPVEPEGSGKPAQNGDAVAVSVPANVKAFMRRKEITQQQIEALVMIEDGDLHFLKEPTHGQAAKGQCDWALLLALKNGLLNNNLKADPEEVRSMVQEKGFYDKANYATNFKKPKYAGLFKAPLESQGEAQGLTIDGETALADLIKALVGNK